MVVCGSLQRQRDTASLALAEAQLFVEPLVDPRWDEYDHADLLRHSPSASQGPAPASSRELQVFLDEALLTWVQEGSEQGWGAFSGGAWSALEELIAALGPGRDAIVFTSGGVIAAISSAPSRRWGKVGGDANRVAINSAITKLIVGPSGISLSAFNEHAHLEKGDVTSR